MLMLHAGRVVSKSDSPIDILRLIPAGDSPRTDEHLSRRERPFICLLLSPNPPNKPPPYPSADIEMDTSKLNPRPREPAKPILKHDTHLGAAPSSDNKQLVWDEDAIEEHDKLRGTRMKIDEPDTPYTHYDASADEDTNHPRSPDESEQQHDLSLASQWGDVASKLQAVADKRDATPGSPTRSPMKSDEDKRLEEEERARKFKEARKKHYNEAEMMRRWKAEHADDDEDDDDDDRMEE